MISEQQRMNARVRTRLSPEARKNQLLNTAKQMIIDRGLQRFTMEALARSASVTSPLVYNYFASRQELLEALLQREYLAYTHELTESTSTAENFSAVVRLFISSNFDHYAPGNILPILLSQPEIVAAVEATQAQHNQQIATFLVQSARNNYKLTKPQAKLLMYMSSGASKAAAEYFSLNRVNREKTIDTVLTYVLSGLSIFKQANAK